MADYTGAIVSLAEVNLARDSEFGGGIVGLSEVFVTRDGYIGDLFTLGSDAVRDSDFGFGSVVSFIGDAATRKSNYSASALSPEPNLSVKSPYGEFFQLMNAAVETPNFPASVIEDIVTRVANRDFDHVGVIGGPIAAGLLSPRGHVIGGLTAEVKRSDTFTAAYQYLTHQAGLRQEVVRPGKEITGIASTAVAPFRGILSDPGLVVLSRNDVFTGMTIDDAGVTVVRSSEFPGMLEEAVKTAAFSNTYAAATSKTCEDANRVTDYPTVVVESGINTSEKPNTYAAGISSLDRTARRWSEYDAKVVTTGIYAPVRNDEYPSSIISVESQTRRDSDFPGFLLNLDIKSRLENMVNGKVVDEIILTAINRGNKTTNVIHQEDVLIPTYRGTGYDAFVFHPEPALSTRDRDYVGRILSNLVRAKRNSETYKWTLYQVQVQSQRNQRVLDVQVIGDYDKVELAKRLKQLRNLPHPADARRMYFVV